MASTGCETNRGISRPLDRHTACEQEMGDLGMSSQASNGKGPDFFVIHGIHSSTSGNQALYNFEGSGVDGDVKG
jgi:hypothetical protein